MKALGTIHNNLQNNNKLHVPQTLKELQTIVTQNKFKENTKLRVIGAGLSSPTYQFTKHVHNKEILKKYGKFDYSTGYSKQENVQFISLEHFNSFQLMMITLLLLVRD